MEYLWELFTDNLATIILTVSGIFAGAFVNSNLQKKPKLSYEVSSLTVLANEGNLVPSKVTVLFGKSPINCLVRERITFWNDGNDTLHGTDIAKEDPLRISFGAKDVTVLMSNVIKCTRKANIFAVVKRRRLKELLLQYDYLDPDDGAVIEVWHNGKQSEIAIVGAIKGLRKGVKRIIGIDQIIRNNLVRKNRRRLIYFILNTRAVGPLLTFAGLLVFFLSIANILFGFREPVDLSVPKTYFGYSVSSSDLGLMTAGILYVVLGGFVWWFGRRRYPKSLIVE